MVEKIVKEMTQATINLKDAIKLDIEDVKNANHEKLLERNDYKLSLIDKITYLQNQLTVALSNEIEKGTNIEIYKENIDNLEKELKKLYELNGKLASIVLPVKELYSEIIKEIEKYNGGNIVEVRV